MKLWKGVGILRVMMHEASATGFNAIYDFSICFAIVFFFCFGLSFKLAKFLSIVKIVFSPVATHRHFC